MEKRTKVLFIHNTLSEYRIQFFCELAKRVELTLVITDSSLASKIYNLETELPREFDIIKINSPKQIKQIIGGDFWDIVLLPPLDTFYQLKCAFVALKFCKQKGINTAYWTEKWEAPIHLQPIKKMLKNKLQSSFIGYIARHVDLCIAAGSKSHDYFLKQGVPLTKIHMAYDSSTSPVPFEHIDIRKKYNVPSNHKLILFFSRVVRRKGCDLLVQAFEKLNLPNTTLLICGEGEDLQMIKTIVDENFIKNVTFCGKVQPNVRADYFEQSNVFVLPSYSLDGVIEAWGLTCNEALEQGTTVVATTAVGAAHDLADGKCCIMVQENNIDALAWGIKQAILSGNLNVQCKELYERFSISNMAESFSNAFKSC